MRVLPAAPPIQTGKTPYRADSLLSLRGLAALLVVCHHLGLGPAMAATTGIAVLGAFAVSGSYAVFVFFCISGYLMAKILDRDYGPGSLSRFYWNRAARILPVYYLAVVFTAVVLPYAISLHDWQVLLFLNNYFPARFPNAPLWSLATEVQFYILAPAFAWATRRWRAAPLVLLAAGAGCKLFYWFGFELLPSQQIVYMGLEANLIYFMTGWSAYTYRDRLPTIGAATGIALIGVALAGMWLFHFCFIENTALGLYRSPAWMLGFPPLMCVVALVVLPGHRRWRYRHETCARRSLRLVFPRHHILFGLCAAHGGVQRHPPAGVARDRRHLCPCRRRVRGFRAPAVQTTDIPAHDARARQERI